LGGLLNGGELKVPLAPEDFSREDHRLIFKAIEAVRSKGTKPDLLTVSIHLKENNLITRAGGADFILGLTENTIPSHVDFYSPVVKRKAELRHLREMALKVAQAAEQGQDLSHLLTSRPAHSLKTIQPLSGIELAAKELNPPSWIIPDLLPEGLSILAGKPKIGKSWLALNLSVALATGGLALGQFEVSRAEALFLGLEDSERRLRDRLLRICAEGPIPSGLYFIPGGSFPRLDQGALELLENFLQDKPDIRLIVLDTLAKIRPPRARREDPYEGDVAVMSALQRFTLNRSIALLVIHHTRKASADDFLECVSGTFGITGTADTIAVLERKDRQAADAVLKITGRDVEDQELALKFHRDIGTWNVLGAARDYALSQERRDILLVLKEAGPKTPKQLVKILGKTGEAVRILLLRMKAAGEVFINSEGKYEAI